MTTLYIAEFPELPVYQGGGVQAPDMPPIAEQTVGNAGASTQSAAFNAKTRIVRLHTDSICSVAFGASPTATTANARLPANGTEYFHVRPDLTSGLKLAAILNT